MAGRQGRAQGRERRDLHGSRQRLAEPLPQQLYPVSQNGFGLNPAPGAGDTKHQYFGEAAIAKDIRLAKNAVVLLNHLCYASGNTEPGLAEGSLADARQRVDNFAAGFIAAGASAVVAEAHDSPNHMLRSVLAGRGGLEAAWRRAPSANGNVLAFDSVRSPGYVAAMDPDRADSGFTRSIVLKRGLASADVLRGARGRAAGPVVQVDPASLVPSLVGTGLTLQTPALRATTAGATIWYRIPYTIGANGDLPDGLKASIRWDALDPAGGNVDPDATPDFGLVVPEQLGEVVAPSRLTIDKKHLSIRVTSPAARGRYRLTVALHDQDGVAFDPASQGLLSSLIVRLTGEHDAAIVAPASVELGPGDAHALPLWVTNLGTGAWGQKAVPGEKTVDNGRNPTDAMPATYARVVATWVSLSGDADSVEADAAAAAAVTPALLPPGFEPRAVKKTALLMFAPSAPGDYLLLIDIVTPEIGSLAAQDVDPTIVRVRVAAPAAVPGDPGA